MALEFAGKLACIRDNRAWEEGQIVDIEKKKITSLLEYNNILNNNHTTLIFKYVNMPF